MVDELKLYKKAFDMACKKLADIYGECPYSNMDLQLPDYCEKECSKHNKFLCWDIYLLEKAENNEDLYGQLCNYRSYIDNHEEIWKRNAEIDKLLVRKETAKEILSDIGNIRIHPAYEKLKEFEWFNLFAKKYGVEINNEI